MGVEWCGRVKFSGDVNEEEVGKDCFGECRFEFESGIGLRREAKEDAWN